MSTYYLDSDGNTYTDQALTTPACGSVIAADTLTLTDALGITEFTVWLADIITFENDDITSDIINLLINAEDILTLSDFIDNIEISSLIIYAEDILTLSDFLNLPLETTSLILNLSDDLFLEEFIRESKIQWTEIATGTSSWTEV